MVSAHIPEPEIPSPDSINGWVMLDGHLEPLWIDGDILPINWVPILQQTLESDVDPDEDDLDDDELIGDDLGDDDLDDGMSLAEAEQELDEENEEPVAI